MARQVEMAEREHALTLARLSGRTREAEALDREARIEARAREIEAREHLHPGEGAGRARREIKEEVEAEAEGARREWVKGFVDDIRRGGIREALAEQFESAVDRMIDRMIDLLFEIDWAGLLGGQSGGAGGGGWGATIGGVLNGVFGGGGDPGTGSGGWPFGPNVGHNARGTDYWRGGLTWVGEEGPELAWLPRGSKVASNPASMGMLRGAAGGGPSVPHQHFYLVGATIGSDELWRRIERGDRMAARAGADRGAATAVSTVHSTASTVEHSDRMMRG
jgi:hypothetical protein